MIDPKIELFQYRNKESGETAVDERRKKRASLRDAANWTQGAALHAGNEPLVLRGTEALDAGIAFQTVDNFDQLERLYGLNQVAFVEPNWAMKLVHALASPGLATFLLMLGLVGMYIEMKTPGVGVGGVVAALAFLLFFWSKSLEGTATSLEIVMFIGGLVLMLIEIFVVPGVGVFGLTGGLMVIFSLVLASQTFTFPRSGAEMDEMRRSMSVVVGAGSGSSGWRSRCADFLPKAPLFNRLVLEPPPPEERITLSHREALADYSHLVGVTGEAMTDLRPGGRALVGGQLLDVIAEGIPLDRGTSRHRRRGSRQPRARPRSDVKNASPRRHKDAKTTQRLKTPGFATASSMAISWCFLSALVSWWRSLSLGILGSSIRSDFCRRVPERGRMPRVGRGATSVVREQPAL